MMWHCDTTASTGRIEAGAGESQEIEESACLMCGVAIHYASK